MNKAIMVALLVFLLILSCGVDNKYTTLTFRVKVQSAAGTRAAASNLATEISSLKYAISNLAMYEDMTINGTGYSNTQGAVSFFNNWNVHDYDNFDAADAAATDEGFVDLMDPAALQALVASLKISGSQAGEYYFTGADWFKPAKVTASINLGDGNTVYTKPGTTTYDQVTYQYTTTTATSMASGPAGESVVQFNNGGTWFKFLKPLVITDEDIENQVGFNVALIFNPDGFLQAWNSGGGSSNGCVIKDNGTNAISLPFLDLVPVAYKDGETVVRESYLFTVNDSGDNFDVRLEIYTVDMDPSSVYAANLRHLINGSGQVPSGVLKIFYAVAGNGGAVTFEDWQHNSILADFHRLVDVNDTGTVAYTFNSGASNRTLSVTYTLAAKDNIQ